MRILFILGFFWLLGNAAQGQHYLPVTDVSFRLSPFGGEDTMFFAFASGDEVRFRIVEERGRQLSELEVFEFPNRSLFQVIGASEAIENSFVVQSEAVYGFRFKNNTLSGRRCQLIIERKPKNSAFVDFNTGVRWVNLIDTIWRQEVVQLVDKIDTLYEEIIPEDNKIMLHSRTHVSCLNSPASCTKSTFPMKIPPNTEHLLVHVIADEAVKSTWESLVSSQVAQQGANLMLGAMSGGASFLVQTLSSAAAANSINAISSSNSPNKLDIAITECSDANNWMIDQSNSFNSPHAQFFGNNIVFRRYVKLPSKFEGDFCLCLKNNNIRRGIPVYLNVVAMRIIKSYRTEIVDSPSFSAKRVPLPMNQ